MSWHFWPGVGGPYSYTKKCEKVVDTQGALLTSKCPVATACALAMRVSKLFCAAALSELNKLLALVQEPSWNHSLGPYQARNQ